MSTAEIADNKWEVQASKAPIATAGGLLQIVMFLGFAGLFVYITAMSVFGAITPKAAEGQIEKQFKKNQAPAATSEEP